jgi:hypothetical protein
MESGGRERHQSSHKTEVKGVERKGQHGKATERVFGWQEKQRNEFSVSSFQANGHELHYVGTSLAEEGTA